jgi:hypothetical protein
MTHRPNPNIAAASSRPLGVAQSLVGKALDAQTVFSRSVILTGEQETLITKNGRWCLLDCLQLLPRVVGPLTVVLPIGIGELEAEVRAIAARVWTRGSVTVLTAGAPIDMRHAVAVLNIGHQVRNDLPWTSINSDGWLARCSSSETPLPASCGQANPIAALMAASLGVTEVFKRVYGVPPDVLPQCEFVEFSLFELSTSPTGPGPELPETIDLPDTVLIGGGAIGNGLVLLLSQLSLRGRLHIIDKQAFGDENLGTCCLLDELVWLTQPKAVQLATWLDERSGLVVTGEQALVEDARAGAFVKGMAVDLVLNGLDDVQARHDAQLMWPSIMVDGGINAIGAAVVTHRLDQPQGACLRCTFQLPLVDGRVAQAKATGLSFESLHGDPGRLLTEADIEEADEAHKPWLREQLQKGRTICSTIAEGQARAALGVQLAAGFKPSVPFVATASAALVVAQALRSLLYPQSRFVQLFQMANLFLGPHASAGVLTPADARCECTTQRSVILRVAGARATATRATAQVVGPVMAA